MTVNWLVVVTAVAGWMASATALAQHQYQQNPDPPGGRIQGRDFGFLSGEYLDRSGEYFDTPVRSAQPSEAARAFLSRQTAQRSRQTAQRPPRPAYPGQEVVPPETSASPEPEQYEALRQFSNGYYAGYEDGYRDGMRQGSLYVLTPQSPGARPTSESNSQSDFDRRGFRERSSGYRPESGSAEQQPNDEGQGSEFRDQLHGEMRSNYNTGYRIARNQQFVTGEVLRSKYVSIPHSEMNHLVLLVAGDDGRQYIVDLGAATELGAMDLQRGDRLAVVGRKVAVGDEMVIRAREVQAQGQTVAIRYFPEPRPTLRRWAYRPDAYANDLQRTGLLPKRAPEEESRAGQFEVGPQSQRPASGIKTLMLSAYEEHLQPERLTVRPGEVLQLQLVNQGNEPRGLAVDLPTGTITLKQLVEPGMTGTLRIRAPRTPGSYPFYCPLEGQRRADLKGELRVTSGASAGQNSHRQTETPAIVPPPPAADH